MTPDDNTTPTQLDELKETVARLQSDNARLEKLAQQADAANKAKSDFLAMISHEIRTPMNGVIGLTEILLDTELDSKQKHYTNLVLTSARNLLTLINSLLDFSKIEADMMELDIAEFNLRKLASELMTLYNVATERKNVKVYAEIDPRVAELYMGDSYRIRQILVNLLGNGIKFTDEGSVVLKVNFDNLTVAGKDVLRFEVIDSGPGIPSDKLDRLFKPFSQVDASSTRRYGGTGLGLSICQKLVELMNGEIGVTSEMGEGSTFWITLPLEPAVGQSNDTEEALSHIKTTLSARNDEEIPGEGAMPAEAPLFMVVDDDETNRFVLETVLVKSGARVLTARNGQEAIDLFVSNTLDLILMDCQMPVMDGFEASERIQAKAIELCRKKPCIIALTADATHSTKKLCKEVGMDDYLTKPLEFGILQRVIDNWLPGSDIRIIAHRQDSDVGDEAEMNMDEEFQGVQIDPTVLERLKQNMGDIRPVIRVFLGSLPGRLDEMKKAVDNSDHEVIRRVAHTLKGSSSQFGAVYISNLCFQAENMAKVKNLENINAIYKKISHAADKLVKFLSEELDKK
jgi:nitrogen-specific signal transduction histidine kinase/CheY-like chemotaxis protein/HPt (histidine-containing phosphotransfer) domain-containing protein